MAHPQDTQESAFISASDHVLNTAPNYGIFRPFQQLVNFGFVENGYEEMFSELHWEQVKMNRFGTIYEYMLNQGYIKSFGQDQFELTDLGRSVKTKGGHLAYWKWVRDKDHAIVEQIRLANETATTAKESLLESKKSTSYNKITMLLIAAYTAITLIIAIATIITCNHSNRDNKIQSKAANSTKEAKESKITDTVR